MTAEKAENTERRAATQEGKGIRAKEFFSQIPLPKFLCLKPGLKACRLDSSHLTNNFFRSDFNHQNLTTENAGNTERRAATREGKGIRAKDFFFVDSSAQIPLPQTEPRTHARNKKPVTVFAAPVS